MAVVVATITVGAYFGFTKINRVMAQSGLDGYTLPVMDGTSLPLTVQYQDPEVVRISPDPGTDFELMREGLYLEQGGNIVGLSVGNVGSRGFDAQLPGANFSTKPSSLVLPTVNVGSEFRSAARFADGAILGPDGLTFEFSEITFDDQNDLWVVQYKPSRDTSTIIDSAVLKSGNEVIRSAGSSAHYERSGRVSGATIEFPATAGDLLNNPTTLFEIAAIKTAARVEIPLKAFE